jgi:hypothetical protein
MSLKNVDLGLPGQYSADPVLDYVIGDIFQPVDALP